MPFEDLKIDFDALALIAVEDLKRRYLKEKKRMGDNVRYIGPYVLGKSNEKWQKISGFDVEEKLGLKKLVCLGYECDPIFIPKDAHTIGSFEDSLVQTPGGALVGNFDPAEIKKDLSKLSRGCKEDIKKLEKTIGPLELRWGLVTQWS